MRDNEQVAFIVNPMSAHGRTGKRWRASERAIRGVIPEFTVFATEYPGHATQLTQRALWEGFTRIISVGGDGTHHEVTNGFFEGARAINPNAIMGILPYGTGSDLARTLRVPRSRAALKLLASDNIVTADVGRITFTLPRGGEGMCHFLNTCHMGIGSEISHLVNINTKAFGGFPSFFWATVTTLGTFSPKFMRISIDDLYVEQDVVDFIVCNGQYDGGGMHVAPKSRLDDGLFDIYLIGRVAPADAIVNLPKLYRGKLTKRPDVVKYFRGRTIRVESTDIVRIAPDGENPGYLPATLQNIPRILKVIAGWSSREKAEAASPVPSVHPAAAAAR